MQQPKQCGRTTCRVLAHRQILSQAIGNLLENAIKYGFETSPGVLRIKIEATVRDNELRAVVENRGRWIEPVTPAPRGTQIGLSNLKRRLELHYQGRAKFHQESLPEAVRMTLTLPLDPAR